MKLQKYIAGIVAASVAAASLTSCNVRELRNQRTVTVVGRGEVKVESNQARIALSVVTRNSDVIAATQENAEKMASVKTALRDAGVPFKDITTSNYSIYQDRNYVDSATVYGGYNVSNQINILVTDITRAGSIIDTAVNAGANQLSSLSYFSSNTEEAEKEARLNAIKQAESLANTLVTASGATLGKVLSISEHNDVGFTNGGLRNAVYADQATPVSGGDYTVSVTVTATYEIR